MYIVVEGVDTSGKTTQIDILKKNFPKAVFTKEPGGSEFGVKIREILLQTEIKSKKAELLLFLADRAEHYEKVIKPNEEKIIFSDRSFISGVAYALANNHQIDIDFLIELNMFVLEKRMPNLIVLLKTDGELIKERMKEKQEDMIESRGVDYLLRVQNCMQNIIKKLEIECITIDSNDSIEIISQKINLSIGKKI